MIFFLYVLIRSVDWYLSYEKVHISLGNYLSGIIKVAVYNNLVKDKGVLVEEVQPFSEGAQCKIDELMGAKAEKPNKYCNVTLTEIPTKYCRYWEYGRPCVAISINNSVYNNEEVQKIIVDAIRRPCKAIAQYFKSSRHSVSLNRMFYCAHRNDFQYYDVVMILSHYNIQHKSAKGVPQIIGTYFGDTVKSSLIKRITE